MMGNRYDKYKDSGIAWIGEIPEHWEIIKIKYILKNNSLKVGPFGSQLSGSDILSKGKYWIYNQRTVLDNNYSSCNSFISNEKYNDLIGFKVSAGDILLTTRGTIGKISRIPSIFNEGVIHPCIIRFNINEKILKYEILRYIFNDSDIVTNQVKYNSNSTTIDVIYSDTLKNIVLAYIPQKEQQSIAAYLDQKCGEIDELITLQEEMITKLQSYKQAVITEAVTKGLDKNVPLKDSGIEWLGEIPEHWKICKLKNIFLLSTGTTPKDFDNISEGENLINWYTPSDILDSCNDLFSSQRKLSEKLICANKISLFPIGTLLYVGIGASAGKVGYANEQGYSNQQITGLLPLNCYSRFYFYYLSVLKDKIRDNAFFTTLPIINNTYLGQELIPFPPLSEQQAIADYLDQRCSEINELISIKQQKIEKLKEYKKSLIFECVTGKRKVS